MHSKLPDATAAREHLLLAANRVAAVARVHRHFHSDPAGEVSCIEFIRRLCADLSTILERSIHVYGDEGVVPTSSVLPIGLIVNELVTNAAKHGAGRIDVNLNASRGRREIVVCDQGRGLPPGFDPDRNRNSLGMRVVSALARQLGGNLTAGANPAGPGACFKVAFTAGV